MQKISGLTLAYFLPPMMFSFVSLPAFAHLRLRKDTFDERNSTTAKLKAFSSGNADA